MVSVLKLWNNFELAKLHELMRPKSKYSFIDVVNSIWIGEIYLNSENIIKLAIASSDNTAYLFKALHLLAEKCS